MIRLLLLPVALLGTVLLLDASLVRGEVTRREANRLAVDVLTLHIGGDVRGVILGRTETEIRIAVRRAWLAEHHPELLKTLPAGEGHAKRNQQLIDRIDAWLDDLGASKLKPPLAPQLATVESRLKPQDAALLRVLQAERDACRQYVVDPRSLPPGEGTTQQRQEAYRQLAARLDGWISELNGSPQPKPVAANGQQPQNRDELIRILKKERETYAAQMQQPHGDDASRFVTLTLSRADVALAFAQGDVRRKLASVAYMQGTADVETKSVTDLQRELAAAGIDWQQSAVDAAQLAGEPLLQDDRQWAARRAIYEYEFLQRLEFQGTGNLVVPTGAGAPPPNLAQLMQGMLEQQQSAALGDLLDEPIFTGLDFGGLGGKSKAVTWLQQATRAADKQGLCGVRITRMTPDVPRRQTVVEDRFLARMPDGTWETIWMRQTSKAAAGADPHDLDRIRQDPQLKEVLGLAEGLGLGGGPLDLALQFGAATMNAQQASDDAFYEFRHRYSQSLAGPPLSWK